MDKGVDSMRIADTPEYFSILNETDKQNYAQLQRSLESSQNRSSRNKKTEDLESAIDEIRRFCVRGDSEDCKRCIVCGTCWLLSGLAVNIKQLQCLIHKCKSSINTTLRKIGYELTQPRGDVCDELTNFLPMIKGKINELRKWSIRTPPNWSEILLSNKNSTENTNHIENSSPLSPSPNSSIDRESTEQLCSNAMLEEFTWEDPCPHEEIFAENTNCSFEIENTIPEQNYDNFFEPYEFML